MTYPFEQVFDTLAAFLHTNAAPTINAKLSGSNTIDIVIGDPGMGIPDSLPTMWIVPLYEGMKPYTGGPRGFDIATWAVPIVIVDDLYTYGGPVANANAAGTFEYPGYRNLMQYGQIVAQALRGSNGLGITLGGTVGTSFVPAITTIWVTIDNKPYRGVRVAFQVSHPRVQRV